MENVPTYVSLSFIAVTLISLFLFFKATAVSNRIILIMFFWLIFQTLLSYRGFYLEVSKEPFRFLLAAPPAILVIIGVFCSKKGRSWIQNLSLKKLTLIHVVRIPVEIVLYWFFLSKMIPELMTFSGRNFDILVGVTAPLIYYFVFIKNVFGRKGLLLWNFVGLALLLQIVISAILSVPTSFQQFGYDQPNVAILYFPLIWLPTFVVPVVLFAHLVVIYRLLLDKGSL